MEEEVRDKIKRQNGEGWSEIERDKEIDGYVSEELVINEPTVQGFA